MSSLTCSWIAPTIGLTLPLHRNLILVGHLTLQWVQNYEYCEKYILPQPGNWPGQFYSRRVVHSSDNNTIGLSVVPPLGPLHVSLNGQENVYKEYYELLLTVYQYTFGKNKPLTAEKCLPWKIALVLELCYRGWSLIRENISTVFGNQCKDLQFLTLIDFLENYLPLVLTIYAVIFRSNNFKLYISALKRIWHMFLCFATTMTMSLR